MSRARCDKAARGFTVFGGPSDDKSNTLVRFATFAMQDPPEEAPNATDKKTGEALGRRIDETAQKLSTA
ncbi:MAG: hypothetical protein GY838_02100 [bacterium]|nr:hypothetical protein [bacterium]